MLNIKGCFSESVSCLRTIKLNKKIFRKKDKQKKRFSEKNKIFKKIFRKKENNQKILSNK